ncbi:MAG: PD40 domain-containing protein [Deltaproteobacteria bacterium]|nr:PD40 domain-containing protein [Deltaproteobacteria bacterium]
MHLLVELRRLNSIDGKEFYFSRRVNDTDKILVLKQDEDNKLILDTATFFTKYFGFEPHFSQNSKLYFTRFAPTPGGLKNNKNLNRREKEAQMVNIWVSEKDGNRWGEPKFAVNGMYATTLADGTIYTTNIHENSLGIIRYKFADGNYSEGENLALDTNLLSAAAHPCIAPDESYIIFDSKVTNNPDNDDLFICFRQKDGSWSKAFNLGEKINTLSTEMCPALSPDNKYLFYHSQGDIYWVDIKIIDQFRPLIRE